MKGHFYAALVSGFPNNMARECVLSINVSKMSFEVDSHKYFGDSYLRTKFNGRKDVSFFKIGFIGWRKRIYVHVGSLSPRLYGDCVRSVLELCLQSPDGSVFSDSVAAL